MYTTVVVMVVVMWWLRMVCHGSCGRGGSSAGDRCDDCRSNGIRLLLVKVLLLVKR